MRPSRARVRAPVRSTREASRNPAVAELSSSRLPMPPAWVGVRSRPRSSRPTVVGSRYGARYPAVKRATRGQGVMRGAYTGVPRGYESDGAEKEGGGGDGGRWTRPRGQVVSRGGSPTGVRKV